MTNKYNDAFTYGVYPEAPENEETDYVVPELYDAIVTRFTDITADMAFAGKSLTGAGGIIREVSRYNGSYYASEFAADKIQPSRKAYHELPLVSCNMTKHNFSITAIEKLTPLTFITNTPNGVYTGQRFQFQNFTSTNSALQTAINNNNFYIRKIDDNSVELYYDSELKQPVDGNALVGTNVDISKSYEVAISRVSATATRNIDGTFTPSFRINTWQPHGMHSSAKIVLTGFTHYAFLNGRTFYVKTFDKYPYLLELYLDDKLTQPFDVTSYDSQYDLSGITGTASFNVNVNVADIAESAPQADATSRQIRITTDTEHGLIQGVHDDFPALPVTFSNSTYINFGTNQYYVKVIDNFTLDLFLDAELLVPARLADITYNKSGNVVSADAISITWNGLVAANPLKLQSASSTTGVNGRSIRFGTNDLGLSTTTDYYLKTVGTNFAEVYTDAALTVPVTIANVGADTYGTAVVANNGNYPEYVSISAYGTFTITTSTGRIYIDSIDSSFRAAQGITDPGGAYRVFYTQQPTGTDVTTLNHPANKIAFSQRVRAYTDVSPYPYTDCFATVEWLPVTYNLGNGQTAYLYIVRYFTDRSCTIPMNTYNPGIYNKIQCDSYNRYYITSFLSLNGVKFRLTGKSAATYTGPWVGVSSSGAAKYNPNLPSVAQRAMGVYNSTAYPALNGGSYYTKATVYSETHNETSDSIVYDVELFTDSGLTVPKTLPAIAKSISSTVGTLVSTIGNQSHRTLRYVPIVDNLASIQSGQRFTFSNAYKSTINGTYYVKVIRRFQYTGQPRVTLVELYANADLSGLIDTTVNETAADNTVISYALSTKVYSNLYMPKIAENAAYPFRNGLRLTMSGTHIPYINGNSYYVLDYIEPSNADDYDIGRHRMDLYTDAEFANRVDLQALAYAGTIPKLDYVDNHSVIPGDIYGTKYNTGYNIFLCSPHQGNDTMWVSVFSDYHFDDGEYVHIGGDYDQWAYVEYMEAESAATNLSEYRLWANSNLTGAVTLTLVFPTVAGNTQPSQNEPHPWKVASINKFLKGNKTYQRWNKELNGGAGGYEFAPWAYDFKPRPNVANGYSNRPSFTFTPRGVDDWRIGDLTLNAADPGAFANNAGPAIVFRNAENNGNEPGTNFDPELGIFDTKDEWVSTSYSAGKEWPTHIMPSSATIRTEQPTRITTSQSMQRYVRSSGNIRYSIDLEYAPMHADDFAKFRSVIEAMQGQLIPVKLKLGVILKDPLQTIGKANLFNNTQMATTKSVLNVEGLAASNPQAIRQGQFIQILDTNIAPNGGIAVALHDAESNSWGETAVRITHPLRNVLDEYTDVNLRPDYVVVTMNTDSTEYNVSTSLHYTLKVSFILQGWA